MIDNIAVMHIIIMQNPTGIVFVQIDISKKQIAPRVHELNKEHAGGKSSISQTIIIKYILKWRLQMQFKSLMTRTLITLTLISALILIFSCEQNTPVAPQESGSKVTILKVSTGNPASLHKLFKAAKVIDEDGGTIIWGDDAHGYTFLHFPEDAVSDATQIYGYWESEALLQADFYPEGLQFNKPVYLRMSYRDADFSMVGWGSGQHECEYQ